MTTLVCVPGVAGSSETWAALAGAAMALLGAVAVWLLFVVQWKD